ncbi:MAG: YfhO family protein, partial [Gemmatimonadetes bacterium]|nr:YfhO family protein [Gemmatimonadota bacterium]
MAAGCVSLWIAVLTLPMWTGNFLASPYGDQLSTGYGFRAWGAEQWRSTGSIPLWNPEIFGGLPFVAAQHGDIFYPTAFVRLVLPVATAMNLGFAVHYILAGLFAYLLLRKLEVSWTGSVVGALAYQLSGVVASLVQPGHDGKLFVTALLPLALLALMLGLRERRFEGHGLLALSVGLALLSPHYQMTYYMLIVAGLFALYLTFGESHPQPVRQRLGHLGLALAAVLVGFGMATIQILPFYHYLPFSPRAEGYYGFEGSTSYAIPWEHAPEFFFANFAGSRETYWGTNPLKLHSEYLGLPVVGLAVLGAAAPAPERRRVVWWLGGIGALFLLISLGAATPFYRVWWTLMPFVKQTRAPGMAFFVVALVVSSLAAFGVERLERGQGRRHAVAWLAVGGLCCLLAFSGALGGIAESFARDHQAQGAQMGRDLPATARAAADGIRWGGVVSALALLGVGVVTLGALRGMLNPMAVAIALIGIPSADLWRNASGFWTYTTDHQRLYGHDPVLDTIRKVTPPIRALDLGAYPGSSLMAHRVAQLLGHHGNELRHFDELLGGKNEWRNLGTLGLWDLFAIQYVIAPEPSRLDSLPGYRPVLSGVTSAAGPSARLYERIVPQPYARIVPAAVKATDEQAIATVLDARFSPDRAVLLAHDAPVEPKPVTQLPQPLTAQAAVKTWAPGHMTIELSPAPAVEGYLVVSENFYPDWQAAADGRSVPVVRGNLSLITVVLPAGAQTVELTFSSGDYRLGRSIT